jgi:hypothetical protein
MNTDTPETDEAQRLGNRVDECIALRQMVRELRDALQLATDECLWRSDSPIPLSEEHSQKLYNVAITVLTKANQLLP